MQKKIIALAIAGLMSGAAFAQSNVVISGRLDANVVRWSGGGERLTDVGQSGVTTSRLTFAATEDLGGGLKAGVFHETDLDPGATASNLGDRAAYVFLEGANWGRIQLGMQSSPTDAWLPGYDYAGNFSGRYVFSDANGDFSTIKKDAFAYYSPKFSGLQLAFFHDPDEATVTGTRATTNQIGANYGAGPLKATLAYTTVGNAATGTKKQTDLGLSYDFGVVKLTGVYETNKNATASGDKNKLWMLGAVMPVGKGNIHVGYTKDDVQAANADNKFWSLAYTYGFSKRTTAYFGYGRFATDTASTSAPSASFTNTGGRDYNAVVGGLIHSF